MLITHYQASWNAIGAYRGPVNYPGTIITPADLAAVKDEVLAADLAREIHHYDRVAMVAEIAKPLAVRSQTGWPLSCGEFGCYYRTPQPLRVAWYRDMISVFNEFGIAWANWDYKGSFGLLTPDGPDRDVLKILLQ